MEKEYRYPAPPKPSEFLEGTKDWKRSKKYWDFHYTEEDVLTMIEHYNWEVPVIVSPRAYVSKEIPTKEFVKVAFLSNNQKEIGDYYGVTQAAISLRFGKIPELADRQVGKAMKHQILTFFGLKQCCRCGGYLDIDECFFNSTDTQRSDGKVSHCFSCNYNYQNEWLDTKEPGYAKKRQDEYMANPENRRKKLAATKKWKALNNYRGRSDQRYKDRRPPWCDVKTLGEIWKNTPEGYEVDHIIPMLGELVSGLDIPENCRYLPAKENRSKNNRFVPCSLSDLPEPVFRSVNNS